MTAQQDVDLAIIGGGIVGLATARALTEQPGLSLVVLEAEGQLARHQTGHNSGVIHSGLYYAPGSGKARETVRGRDAMYSFCQDHQIPHERCGKLVVAAQESELAGLEKLHQRGLANGLEGLQRLGPDELREREPHVRGLAGLWVPETGIVDYVAVARAFARDVEARGGRINTQARLVACRREGSRLSLQTSLGSVSCRALVNCAGLQADRVARICGQKTDVRIVPFRGEYYVLKPAARHLVHNLIYPVPDPDLPFLGVHFTRRLDGTVEAGPNAVLALKREGYGRFKFSVADAAETLLFPGFWRLAAHYWKTALAESWRSYSKRTFVRALQHLVPELQAGDVMRGGCGIRAQALDRSGRLLSDFHILEAAGCLHVLNAPSPAATASLSIGRFIATRVRHLLVDGSS